MSASEKQFLVRRVATGTMATVVSTSIRAAMVKFFCTYKGAEKGEEFMCKERGAWNDWEHFKFTGGSSFRKIPS